MFYLPVRKVVRFLLKLGSVHVRVWASHPQFYGRSGAIFSFIKKKKKKKGVFRASKARSFTFFLFGIKFVSRWVIFFPSTSSWMDIC